MSAAPPPSGDPGIFSRLPLPEAAHVGRALRNETVGGILLLIGAVAALVLANSAASDWYQQVSAITVGPIIELGPITLDLNLKLSTWAADGLLAIFFFVAGVELRHELELGTLADPRKAAVPLAAAIGGMVVPAGIYAVVNAAADDGDLGGWGIPMATDIAFALAVLAVVGRSLPVALRAFLLSLAVVDDLGAIIVIALFYSKGFDLLPFVIFAVLIVLYWILQKRRVHGWWWYLAIAVLAWAFLHESGVHATIAGVACGLLTRVRPDPGEHESPGHRAEHAVRPISAGFAVPVFAFFAAGVSPSSGSAQSLLTDPIAIGVFLGLVVGKPLGVMGTAWLTARFTRGRLSEDIGWSDVLAVGFLAGIGFTVSLLVAELAFADEQAELSAAKIAILSASLVSALLATGALIARNRHFRELARRRSADPGGRPAADADGSAAGQDPGGSGHATR
jgi:NhaA family Na+:H+ antiporter